MSVSVSLEAIYRRVIDALSGDQDVADVLVLKAPFDSNGRPRERSIPCTFIQGLSKTNVRQAHGCGEQAVITVRVEVWDNPQQIDVAVRIVEAAEHALSALVMPAGYVCGRRGHVITDVGPHEAYPFTLGAVEFEYEVQRRPA